MKILTYFTQFLMMFSCFGQVDKNIYNIDSSLTKGELLGNIRIVEMLSDSFDEYRKISIYEPKGFDKDSTYNLIIATDNQCEALANLLENNLPLSKKLPTIVVGIHNREPQPIDSILGEYKVDFRSKEMLGDIWLSKNAQLAKDSLVVDLVCGRKPKYKRWVAIEVINFLKQHYNLQDQKKWIIGGFSNGGAIVSDISCTYPNVFGNIITMSPGSPTGGIYDFDFTNSKSSYFICAGNKETGFHKNSLLLASMMTNKNITFEHKTFDAGHSYDMWLTYYAMSLNAIYKSY